MEMFEEDLREEKGSSFTVGSKVENNMIKMRETVSPRPKERGFKRDGF